MLAFSDIHPTVVYMVDSDVGRKSEYKPLIHRLGFEPQEFTSADQFIATARLEDRPGCLILDQDCEQGRAGELQRRLLDQGIEIPVILTTSETHSRDAIEGLRLGAIALLDKPVSLRLLEEYLNLAACRLQTRFQWKRRHAQLNKIFAALTERQRRVLDYAAHGMLNKTIAARLKVSKRTVEAERSKVLKAFAADSFYDVSMRMGEYGLLNELQRFRERETLLQMQIDAISTERQVSHSV